MSYSINKTDGTLLATVSDGQIDQFSTDITLIGKNYSGFGEVLNENFIKILENFADTAQPDNPVRGQIWFDVSELKLKVYNGGGFVPVSSATISPTQPVSLGAGDLWFDDTNKQLFFYDGSNLLLLGPLYSESQGLSGLQVRTVLDTLNQSRVITLFYTNGVLLGIFSKDSFTPKIAINGFTGSIEPGFNAGSLTGIKFKVTATNSDSLGGAAASLYIRNDRPSVINATVSIADDRGLLVGAGGDAGILVDPITGAVVLINNSGRNFILRNKNVAQEEDSLIINPLTRTVSFYSSYTDSQVNIGGSLTVEGNLTVQGDVTTVNTGILFVEDKNIILANIDDSTQGSEEYADGGGLILRGSIAGGDKEFTWDRSKASWYSTESINLRETSYFMINGVPVLTATELGSTITSIPGVTSFGPQRYIDVGPTGLDPIPSPAANVKLRLTDNRISTVKDNLDLELEPNGTGNVSLIGTPLMTGLATTNQNGVDHTAESAQSLTSTELSEATNKRYVTNMVRTRPIVLSLDISDGISNSQIADILEDLAPVDEYEIGTRARLLCTLMSANSTTLNINSYVNTTTQAFSTPGGGSSPAVIEPVAFSLATIPAPTITPTRVIKNFVIRENITGKYWDVV